MQEEQYDNPGRNPDRYPKRSRSAGTHHHYSKGFAMAYAVESCFKYNIRKLTDPFGAFIKATVTA